MEDVAHLLGAVVGNFDTDVCLICREGCVEAFLLTLREPITRGAQEKLDLIEGIVLASAVSGRVLLDAVAHLIKGVASELDDVKGVEDAGCVLELAKRWCSCCPWKGSSPRFVLPRGSLFRAWPASSHARCQTLPGQGLTSGPWEGPSREWSTMPVSSRGPRRRRSWWCHTPLIETQDPNLCETGGVQMRLAGTA